MHKNYSLLAAMMAASAATGCVARVHGHAYAEAPAPIVVEEEPAPTLVLVEPGVWVVERSPRAVYYVHGYYWRYEDGVWYRTSDWNGGWALVSVRVVPSIIVHRDHWHYVHYVRPPRAVVRHPAVVHHVRQPVPRHHVQHVGPKHVGPKHAVPRRVGPPHERPAPRFAKPRHEIGPRGQRREDRDVRVKRQKKGRGPNDKGRYD